MIDFHSHVLPCVDDGSQSVEESTLMLAESYRQGVETLVATPHFYANSDTVDGFLAKREEAYNKIVNAKPSACPKLLLGAELLFYNGVSGLKDLEKLRIGDSKLLLLEMPLQKWTDYTLKELFELARSSDYTLVLAHIERYYSLQREEVWQSLKDNGVLFQVNASCFTRFRTRRSAVKLMKKGFVHFLGSDCHDTQYRPPVIAPAYTLIRKKLGDEAYASFLNYGNNLVK